MSLASLEGLELETMTWMGSWVRLLDQTLLPMRTKYIKIHDVGDAWRAINRMQVRGAPAVANLGCLSVAAEIFRKTFTSKQDLYDFANDRLNYLLTARPTAVNLKIVARDLIEMLQKCTEDDKVDLPDAKQRYIDAVQNMLRADRAANIKIGYYGADEILRCVHDDSPINILTHCNTGTLATAGYGTALGVIRTLHERNKINHVYYTETRPCFQGTRLTSYELKTDEIPATLICDSMVGALMQKKQITAVVVGADRIVSNGDTANKIGTYQIAVLAKYHDVPFFVAAPRTTIDLSIKTGDDITIEMRPEEEMTYIDGNRIAPRDIKCWNPAFDVTPAKLITSIITERGVYMTADLVKHFDEN